MKPSLFMGVDQSSSTGMSYLLMFAAFVALIIAPEVFAQSAQNLGETGDNVCGFVDSISGVLNLASIIVVTIAVILAGYQIIFAHKRIADVAPILIGGLLIGAASQIARMIIGPEASECAATLMQAAPIFHV